MPDPNSVSPGAYGARVSMNDAPGADQDWDLLFQNPENPTALSPQATQTNGTNLQPGSQTNNDFLHSTDGSVVYKTAEDAIKGLDHKNSEIAKYRNFLKDNGIDPNTMQTVTKPQVQSQPEPSTNSQYKYYGNPNFYDEVAAAATNRDRIKYTQLMTDFTKEAIAAQVDPWRPTLAETNRFKAIRQVSSEIPDFQKFIEGPGAKQVVDTFPLYKEMLQIGENDPVAAQRLPEVYKQMYTIYQGMNIQTQSQAQSTTTTNTPTVQTRPTLQTSSLTPPPPTANTQGWSQPISNRLKRDSNEARSALIQEGDRKFEGMRFDDLGL